MSKETIIHCDCCGDEIKGDPYKVSIFAENRFYEGTAAKYHSEEMDDKCVEIECMHWCTKCAENLAGVLLTAPNLMATSEE